MSFFSSIQSVSLFCIGCFFIVSCSDSSVEIELPVARPIIDTLVYESNFSLKLESKLNPDNLPADFDFIIVGNRFVAQVPHDIDKSNLILSFESELYKVFVDEDELIAGISRCDLSQPRLLFLITNSDTLTYELLLIDKTNLPTVFVETNSPVENREDWVKANMEIVGVKNYSDFRCTDMYIKGRGNTTWDKPQKPYSLKFAKRDEVLGMPACDRWVLLTNAFDPTMLRSFTGFYLSANQSKLDYTPRMVFVDLYLNGQYQGVYEFGEHIKIDENRVNVSQEGFILEVDAKWNEGEPVFTSPLGLVFNIKDPGLSITADEFEFIRGYISQVENLLYSSDFTENVDLYKEFIDIESFVDWYLINEITKNNDAIFFTSCYMNLKPGEKLKMGPVWDFDLAIGNVDYNNNDVPEGFWIKDAAWINRMFLDPEFVSLVKLRFAHFYNSREQLYRAVKIRGGKLKTASYANNRKWHTLSSEVDQWDLVQSKYIRELHEMLDFLEKRYEWLNENINAL
jgi:hypothetical protein